MFLALFACSFSPQDDPGCTTLNKGGSAIGVLQENTAVENKADIEEDL